MKKFTQKEFNNFPIINGYRQCPTGDYSEIKEFGNGCKFGKGCSINLHVLKNKRPLLVVSIGNHRPTLYVWDTEDGVYCQLGCFFGTYKKFKKLVNKQYGKNHKYIKAVKFLLEDYK